MAIRKKIVLCDRFCVIFIKWNGAPFPKKFFMRVFERWGTMRKIGIFLAAFMSLAFVFAAGCAPASAKESPAATQEITGGYTEDGEATSDDTAIFDKVMNAKNDGKQYEVLSVATQVVAGTNYRFKVKVTDGGSSYEAYVYIFEPLPNENKEPEFVKEEKI